MNKKEIAEIKKQFSPNNTTISRIAGCYVDSEKNKAAAFMDAFLSLPEEEAFKYYEIFRKTLSGTPGKNLLTMEFPLETEEEGQTQAVLLSLRDSALKDPALLEEYYDSVIESFTCSENYLILVIYGVYDVPGKASDNLEMFDASDEVYQYIVSCICPVVLEKPALSYDAEEKSFRSLIRSRIVQMPQIGFLFPAFHDRSSDIHSILYYTKSADDLHTDFTDRLLGCVLPMPAKSQRQAFTDIVEETLGEDCSYEVVQNLHENLHELNEQLKDSPDPVILHQSEIRNLLEESGADAAQMERFDTHFEENAGTGTVFLASNLTGMRKYEVKTPDVTIQVSPDRADLVEKRMIDGRLCLVIPITDEVQVNGIRVSNKVPV